MKNVLENRSIFSVNSDEAPYVRKRPKQKCKRQNQCSQEQRLNESYRMMSKSPMQKMIKVPITLLIKEWKGEVESSEIEKLSLDSRLNKWTEKTSNLAIFAMKKVGDAVRKLRQCCKIYRLQKASIQVSQHLNYTYLHH